MYEIVYFQKRQILEERILKGACSHLIYEFMAMNEERSSRNKKSNRMIKGENKTKRRNEDQEERDD